jgi:hypothetical protein
MLVRLLYSFALLSVFCSLSSAAIVSDFNAGLDGWTATGSGSLSHSLAGGNPLGFARFDDVPGTGGDGFLVAPAKFLGDWSLLDGNGALEWEHIILRLGDASDLVNARATIAGPGGEATFVGPLHQTTWITLSAPISSANWFVLNGSWNALLANVTSLQIRIEAVHNDGAALDIDGIDNVQLVPEPGTLSLLCAGAFIAIARFVRRHSRAS